MSPSARLSRTKRGQDLQPLYKAAKFAIKSRVYAPGELRVPDDFVQTDESPFIGRYTDPNHPGGYRVITLKDQMIAQFRLAEVKGGGGKGEPELYTLPALVYGDRITVDFSPKGGPAGLTGTFAQNGIKWPDGNKWPQVSRDI